MASQIDLLIEYCDYESDSIYKSKQYVLDLRKKCLFSFDESDNIFITLSFNQNSHHIYIDSYEDEKEIELIPDKRYHLSSGREDLGCYYPGYFNMVVTSDHNEKEEYLFLVQPKNVELNSILEIRKYVNDFYHGLSNNYNNKTKTHKKELNNEHIPNITEKYYFLIEKFDKIINLFEQYVQNENSNLMKTNKISSKISKVSNSSIKWLSTKGMSKNFNVYSPEKILSKKVVTTNDIPDNRIMKNEIIFWKFELTEVISSIESFLSDIKNQILDKEIYINDLQETVEKQESNKYVNVQVKKKDTKRLEQYRRDKNEDEIIFQQYLFNYKKLTKYRQNIEHILFNTWITSIEPENIGKVMISDKRLRQEILLKNEYLGINLNGKNNIIGFAEKCTPKLFETYIYVLLINMLIENGYELVSHDFEKDNLVPILSNQGQVTLFNGEQYCEILYDCELKKSNDNNLKNEFVTINSTHNRPDFIVSFYKSKVEIEKAIVVEVKWRPKSAIFNEIGDTNVVTNLKDYFSLGYHTTSPKSKTKRGVIDKALVVYPDLEERVINIQDEELVAIGLKPGLNIIDTSGYKCLYEYIINE